MRRRSLVSAVGILATIGFVGCGDSGGDQAATNQPPVAEQPTTPPSTPEAGGMPSAPGGNGLDPQLVQAGQQVFAGPGLCTACHGPTGTGTALAPDLTDDVWLWIENPSENLQEKIVERIRIGVPQPREAPAPMPPMGGASLNDEQLNAVAAYVVSLSQS